MSISGRLQHPGQVSENRFAISIMELELGTRQPSGEQGMATPSVSCALIFPTTAAGLSGPLSPSRFSRFSKLTCQTAASLSLCRHTRQGHELPASLRLVLTTTYLEARMSTTAGCLSCFLLSHSLTPDTHILTHTHSLSLLSLSLHFHLSSMLEQAKQHAVPASITRPLFFSSPL